MSAGWPHGDPRDVARAVLADPRFHAAAHGPAPKSLWELVWDALKAIWDHTFGALGKFAGNETVTDLLGVAVLVAALVFLALVTVRFTRRLSQRAHRTRVATVRVVPLDEEADARTLRARAATAAEGGRYRAAAALLWLAVLRALDERGAVRYDASRTPGQWRSVVRDPAFDVFAGDAVDALFGTRPVDAALVARMDAAYERLVPA